MATTAIRSIPTDTRRLYARVLAGWASDSLNLRRDGLDRPSERDGRGLGIAPSVAPVALHRTRRAA